MKPRKGNKAAMLIVALTVITVALIRLNADTGICGGAGVALPFADVSASNIFFCAIAEAYVAGLTNGTTPTTYNPSDPVTREQMAAFTTRTMDQSLKRGSKRAALDQYWTTHGEDNLGLTTVGLHPQLVKSDGTDLWMAIGGFGGEVSRVRASDGKLLEVWTGASGAQGVLCAMGKVFVCGGIPGKLYQIDPRQPAGAVSTLSSNLGNAPAGIAYDGQRIWTANQSGSVSIISLSLLIPVATVSTGFTSPRGIVYDGANIWVTDDISGSVDKLRKLDSSGAILLSVDVGSVPEFPAFDGTNIWVPNDGSNTVSVVRATGSFAGTVVATLSGNGLNSPKQAAFDGERILVTNFLGDSVSLWNATDFTPLGALSTGASTFPFGACSDGLNFWISLNAAAELARL